MTYAFTLDKKSFEAMPQLFSQLQAFLDKTHTASSEKEYNGFIHALVALLKNEQIRNSSRLFAKELKDITITSPLIEPTVWGGVSIKKVDTTKDFVQKLLLVKQYGILGFEIHKRKLEKLHVLEGTCLLLSSQHKKTAWEKGQVTIVLGKVGTQVVLEPGDEHGIIALIDCVIEETSTNHLDDLVYIFPSQQLI